MKEVHFFYAPDAATSHELPEEEAKHCTRVLRLTCGEEIHLTDGKGGLYRAVITEATQKRCLYSIEEREDYHKPWAGRLCIGMAPTKNMDRIEWFAEKATEIGVDDFYFPDCKFSERKVLKTERIRKIVVSAMKQSQKGLLPAIHEMLPFRKLLEEMADFKGQKFIAHCYEGEKSLLQNVVRRGEDALVLIGPEGDFSIDEVEAAEAAGFRPVSLGKSRLRTETAALAAVHILNLINQE